LTIFFGELAPGDRQRVEAGELRAIALAVAERTTDQPIGVLA
jgi:hypothetical protein